MNANVLILGATSDIALAVAKAYAEKKHTIILAGRATEKLEILKSDITIRYSATVYTARFDAADTHDKHQQFYNTLPVRPDIVVCAFGYLGDQAIAQNQWSETEKIIIANYTGAVSILNITANDFEQRKAGIIIGISSVAGDRGRQSNYLYGSAKAGFTAYLSGLRNRLFRSGVHVLTVKPGFVNTRMTEGLPLPKILTAQPEQVAAKIVRNASRANTLYVYSIWRWIMLIIKFIPEPIFKKLKL